MNAKPLFTEDKKDTVAYFCSKCRIVKATEQQANDCCKPLLCRCGEELPNAWSSCDKCREADSLLKLKEALTKATRVQSPTADWVYSDSTHKKDGYFEFCNIGEVFEDSEMPLFIYDCTKEAWNGLNADDLIENAFDGDWYEDAADSVVDQEELEKFLEGWNKKQTTHQFTANLKQIIVLDEAKFDAWLADKK